jgi:hypothetical protein
MTSGQNRGLGRTTSRKIGQRLAIEAHLASSFRLDQLSAFDTSTPETLFGLLPPTSMVTAIGNWI